MKIRVHLTKPRLISIAVLSAVILTISAIIIGTSVSLTRKKDDQKTSKPISMSTSTQISPLSMTENVTTTSIMITEELFEICQFIEQSSIVVHETSRHNGIVFLPVTDLNGDHQLDLIYILMNRNLMIIDLGYGNGSFARYASYPFKAITAEISFHLIDLNLDHRVDIIIHHSGQSRFYVRYGYGNGSFAPETMIVFSMIFFPGVFPNRLAFGDLNNDTHIDLIAVVFLNEELHVFLSHGNTNFTKIRGDSMRSGYCSNTISLIDINNDHILDILCTRSDHFFSISLGVGDGSFKSERVHSLANEFDITDKAIGDLNSDGLLDFVFSSIFHHQFHIQILLNNGDETFRNTSIYTVTSGFYLTSIQLEDVNGDKHLDIVTVYSLEEFLHISFGFGNGSFAEPIKVLVNKNFSLTGLALGDFNHDEHVDMVVVDENENKLIVLLNACHCSSAFISRLDFFM